VDATAASRLGPPLLSWKPDHGGLRGTSADGRREYRAEPVSLAGDTSNGWWAVTASEAVTVRRLIGSQAGAVALDDMRGWGPTHM